MAATSVAARELGRHQPGGLSHRSRLGEPEVSTGTTLVAVQAG